MIQVIDYNNGIFGIVQNDNYNSNDLKIGDAEFKLPKDKLFTLFELPTEILKKTVIPATVTHYADSEGNTLSWEAWRAENDRLQSKMVWDEDGDNKIWETRQDKEEYEAFSHRWKGVYSEPVVEWIPVEFEVIKKEYIPEQYAEYIESTIVVGSTSNYGQQAYKAICYYTSDPIQMIRLNGDSYYGAAPNRLRRELWDEMRGMTAERRAKLVQERTGIVPIVDDPQPIIGPFGLEV